MANEQTARVPLKPWRSKPAASSWRMVECECENVDVCARCAAQAAAPKTTTKPPDPDGECYRGGEYEAAVALDMAEARKLK